MKNKQLNKKLELNKTTITNLGDQLMKNALGGVLPPETETECGYMCDSDNLSDGPCRSGLPTCYRTCSCS